VKPLRASGWHPVGIGHAVMGTAIGLIFVAVMSWVVLPDGATSRADQLKNDAPVPGELANLSFIHMRGIG